MHSASTSPTAPPIVEASVFLRMRAVVRLTGLGRSTIYRLVAQDRFPAPVKLASRAVAWRRVDLERWSEVRPNTTH
jgi:prophage regulatory protein